MALFTNFALLTEKTHGILTNNISIYSILFYDILILSFFPLFLLLWKMWNIFRVLCIYL